MCLTLDHSGKPIILITLGQAVGKLAQRELSNYMIKRYIVNILHAMILINDSSCRIKYQHMQQHYFN